MSFLDFFLKKKAPARKAVGTKAKKPSAPISPGKAQQSTTNSSSQKPIRQLGSTPKKELAIIQSMSGVPSHHSVLSADGAELALSSADQVDYIILKIYPDKNDAVFIRSLNKSQETKAGVDHTYLTIKERLKTKQLKIVQEYLAERQILKLIYDKSNGGTRRDLENKSEYIDLIDSVLKDGMLQNVSDIHIEVRRDSAEVRFRKHGDLFLRHDWSVQHAKDASLVLYQVMAEEKDITFNATIAQDAVLDRTLAGKRLRVRVGTIPAAPDGFDVILRLMPYDESEKDVLISELGYIDDQLLDIEMGMSRPIGVIVLAGITGSGKTTSLVAMIRQIIREAEGSIKVITVENPPEQFIKGATQHAVGSKSRDKDMSPYAAAAKAALRADPDYLMVGEVRDVQTAKLLISAVQSGHKVFTTIHAPSGIGIVSRMRSMGIPNDVLGSSDFFSGLIYQTLIKTICPHCSIPLSEYGDKHAEDKKFQKLLRRLAISVNDLENKNIRFVNRSGCSHKDCDKGVTGRTVVAEVIIPDHHMCSLFARGMDMDAWRHFRKSGGKSSLMVGIEKMQIGLLDPFDVESALGLLNSEIIMEDGTFNYADERISQGTWVPVAKSKGSENVEPELPYGEEMDMLMEEPNTELSNLGGFNSEIFSEQLHSAEIISISSRSAGLADRTAQSGAISNINDSSGDDSSSDSIID
jgi:type II secretory ATPase GspE/PulE/Tfp pilus assembly ATPase PilB-like protein